MATVTFQQINRSEIPADTICMVCRESTAEDSGRTWWAHPMLNNASRLCDYIHETCLKRLTNQHNHCGLCQGNIDQAALPALSIKERIGLFLNQRGEDIIAMIYALSVLQIFVEPSVVIETVTPTRSILTGEILRQSGLKPLYAMTLGGLSNHPNGPLTNYSRLLFLAVAIGTKFIFCINARLPMESTLKDCAVHGVAFVGGVVLDKLIMKVICFSSEKLSP